MATILIVDDDAALRDGLAETVTDLGHAALTAASGREAIGMVSAEIDAILARNHEQATGLGFQGTPAFIIGHFRVPGAPNAQAFKQAIADARKAASK